MWMPRYLAVSIKRVLFFATISELLTRQQDSRFYFHVLPKFNVSAQNQDARSNINEMRLWHGRVAEPKHESLTRMKRFVLILGREQVNIGSMWKVIISSRLILLNTSIGTKRTPQLSLEEVECNTTVNMPVNMEV